MDENINITKTVTRRLPDSLIDNERKKMFIQGVRESEDNINSLVASIRRKVSAFPLTTVEELQWLTIENVSIFYAEALKKQKENYLPAAYMTEIRRSLEEERLSIEDDVEGLQREQKRYPFPLYYSVKNDRFGYHDKAVNEAAEDFARIEFDEVAKGYYTRLGAITDAIADAVNYEKEHNLIPFAAEGTKHPTFMPGSTVVNYMTYDILNVFRDGFNRETFLYLLHTFAIGRKAAE